MNLDRKALLGALETLKLVADHKSSIPALGTVQLAADARGVRLSATDLYRSAWVTLPGEGDGTWSRAVDLRTTLDRAKRFRNGHCTLTPEAGQALALTEGPRAFQVRGIDPTDCPPMPDESKATAILTIDAGLLASALDRVLYAVSRDETRAHLNSVRFEVTSERLRLVSTDGHRLALWDTAIEPDASRRDVDFLVSLSGATVLRKLAGAKGAPATVAIRADGSTIFASVRGVTLALRKVDAMFPPYKQVIPATSLRTVTASRALLLEVATAIGACAPDRTGGVKLTLAGETLTVRADDPDAGSAVESMPVTRAGKDGNAAIGVNARYLVDALAEMASETVAIGLSGELDPIVIRPTEGGVTVVMPMRI